MKLVRKTFNTETYNFEQLAEYNGEIRWLSPHGFIPGGHYQMRVPSLDPETGGDLDVDGDQALARLDMVGGTPNLIWLPNFEVTGFVEEGEAKDFLTRLTEHRYGENAYPPALQFHLEQWRMIVGRDA